MKYLFDASSIYSTAMGARSEALIRNYTCDLARYEIGNILLTERYRRKVISEMEQKSALEIIKKALDLMLSITIKGYEQEVIDLSIKHNITFYDAAYVYLAKKTNAALVTEDHKLSNRIKGYVKTIRAKNL